MIVELLNTAKLKRYHLRRLARNSAATSAHWPSPRSDHAHDFLGKPHLLSMLAATVESYSILRMTFSLGFVHRVQKLLVFQQLIHQPHPRFPQPLDILG